MSQTKKTQTAPEMRTQIAAYRRAAADLCQSHTAQAHARAELDRAADATADTKAAPTAEQQAHRAARDRLRELDTQLERARIAERLEREILTAVRVILG